MLNEIAITPDFFKVDGSDENRDKLLLFGHIAFTRPLVFSNLHNGAWLKAVEKNVKSNEHPVTGPLSRDIYTKLNHPQFLVERPGKSNKIPETEIEWKNAALDAHKELPLNRIVCANRDTSDPANVEIFDVLKNAEFWLKYPECTKLSLERDMQIDALKVLLKHADFICFYNQYIQEVNYFGPWLVKSSMERGEGYRKPEIFIHFSDKKRLHKNDIAAIYCVTHHFGIELSGKEFDHVYKNIRFNYHGQHTFGDRLIIAGKFSKESEDGPLCIPLWGVSMNHIARETDKGKEKTTRWSFLGLKQADEEYNMQDKPRREVRLIDSQWKTIDHPFVEGTSPPQFLGSQPPPGTRSGYPPVR